MPIMSSVEATFCRSAPWQAFARRHALPWALDGVTLAGDVLELGSGAGSMADATARRFPEARLTATDLDPAMVRAASARLSAIPNASAEVADVTDLSFADASFDVVLSHLMLHHVIDWEPALAEVRRVLRPGGMLLGYDLTRTLPNSVVHRVDRSPHRLISAAELESRLRELAFSEVAVRPAFAGQVMRFRATV